MICKDNEELILNIEKISKEKKISLLDATMLWCEQNSFEVEVVGNIIKKHSSMKDRILTECNDLNLVKKPS